jgi:hypothetical protein
MSETVLCKDCKHAINRWWLLNGEEYNYYCRKSFKPDTIEPNPVIGTRKVKAKYDTCGVTRIGSPGRDHGRCGEEGLWWEPKNKKDLFKYIKHVSA